MMKILGHRSVEKFSQKVGFEKEGLFFFTRELW